jgi:hypothetical protein
VGAFVLITDAAKPDPATVEAAARRSLAKQGFAEPQTLRPPGATLLIYPKQVAPIANLVSFENDEFCAATGTFVYKGATGKTGLALLHGDFDIGKPETYGLAMNRLHGAFCIVARKQGRTFAFTDRVGVYKVYRDDANSVLSSSFLAMLETVSRRRVDAQALYEYVFQGATYGGDTLAEDVKLLSPEVVCQPGVNPRAGTWRAYGVPEIARGDLETHAEQIFETLTKGFGDIAKAFDNHIDTALSGGYDSRLILAILFGLNVRPDVHVYGRESDPDVVVASRIAKGEGFSLTHVDKSHHAELPLDRAAESISRTFRAFDGAPNDGIFDNGSDFETRRERCRTGALMLNGGGGEVLRNFFYLPDKPLSVRQLLWSFYSQFDPNAAAGGFSEAAFHDRLAEKLKATLGITGDRLTRTQIELVYPLFRCGFWMGRNNSVNSRFGSTLTPFIDDTLVRQTVRVPMSLKDYGRLEARLISLASPALAAYPSDHGYAFDAPPPLSARLRASATYLRPPLLRRYSFRLRTRRAGLDRAYCLNDEYRNAVMEPGFPRIGTLFHADRIVDGGQFNRLCTAEYLFQKMEMTGDGADR